MRQCDKELKKNWVCYVFDCQKSEKRNCIFNFSFFLIISKIKELGFFFFFFFLSLSFWVNFIHMS